MYNLRYHIASLVSVFLALALGLVLGGLVVQRGAFDQQQAGLVEGLQKEFADLRTENGELSAENELLSSFSASMVEGWAAGRLEGRTIVAVVNAGREDGLNDARAAIEAAGGQLAIVTLRSPSLGLSDEDLSARVTSLAPNPEEPQQSIVSSMAAEWAAPGATHPLTAALTEVGAISVEGLSTSAPVYAVIDLAAPESEPDPAAIQLAVAFEQFGPAVGAQPLSLDTGVAAAAAESGLAAVDTLGSEVGSYTLVALLSGAEPAYYGIGPGADARFPEPSR